MPYVYTFAVVQPEFGCWKNGGAGRRHLRVADDTAHRLDTTKLTMIMKVADAVLHRDDLPVEVEYEHGTMAQDLLGGAEVTPAGLLMYLGTKHTAYLAPEKCGVGGSGCC